MNFKQLLFTKSVADTCSFSKAAELCYATQPTLSNAISQLEEEMGGKIFVRTTRKVQLTAFGEYLLPFINEILNNRSELEKAANAYHNPGYKLIRIGLSPLIDARLVNDVLKDYRQEHPEVSIFFKECLLDDLAERLTTEQIDIAILPSNLRQEAWNKNAFYEEPLYYLPQDLHTTQPLPALFTINALPDAPIIMTGGGCGLNGSLENIFKQENVQYNAYPGQALSYQVIEEWASLGIGAGILPKAKISSDNNSARSLQLNNGSLATFRYEWVWTDTTSDRPFIAEFIYYVQQLVPALVDESTSV